MKTQLKKLLFLGYIHEFFHYLPARIFGLEPEINPTITYHQPAPHFWQEITILMSPFAFFCLVFFSAAVDLKNNFTGWRDLTRWLNFLIAIGWMGTCLTDLKQFIRYLQECRNE